MLDKCMEDHLESSATDIQGLGNEFRERLSFAVQLFGKRTFRYEDEKGEWRLSQPLYDAVIVAVDRLWKQKADLLKRKAQIEKALAALLKNKDAYEVIVGRPNTAKAIEHRIALVESALARED